MIYLSKADGKSDEVSAFSSTTEVDAEKKKKKHKMSPGSQMNWEKSYLQTWRVVNFVHPFQKG